MILRSLLIFLACLPFSSIVHGNVWDDITKYFRGNPPREPPSIRVLLLHDVEEAKLEVQGKYSLFDPYTDTHLSRRFSGKCRVIQALGDGLKWGEAFPGLYQIKIKPEDRSTVALVNDRTYNGLLYIYDIGGTISIVNQIPIEDYVLSVLTAYQNQHLEPETLAAIAIAARTNAYFQTDNPKNTYWAIDAEKVGYRGLVHLSSAVENAVKLTRCMIMSRTGVYEGIATPFAAQFDPLSEKAEKIQISKISLQEANSMALKGEHAAQILAKAFPGSTIMLMEYAN
jgi:stage II sporulation protein D